jgi:hypothetical protein
MIAMNKNAKPKLSKGSSIVSTKKESEESERFTHAMQTIIQKMKSSGVRDQGLADKLLVQTAGASLSYWTPKDVSPCQRLELAASALTEMEPSNATEAMLALQMIAVHDAALLFLVRATQENQRFDGCDANVLRATRLMQVFNEQLEAMQKLKGKAGRQKVTVEHVHVHQGGHAIVGAVMAGIPAEGAGDGAKNSGNTP